MTDNQKKIGIGTVVAVLCALAFYFLYWVKTPAYSLNIIKESVEKHDVATFEKHVDMDTLYTKFFDDALIAQGEITGENLMANPFAAGLIQMMKQPAVSYLKSETLKAVKGEETKKDATGDKKAQQAENFANKYTQKFDSKVNSIKDISTLTKDGDTATVLMKIHDARVDKDFDVKMKMTKLDDGTWKLKEVSNTSELLVAMDKAEKDKLAQINKPIREKLAKDFVVGDGTMSRKSDGNPYFASYWLETKLAFTNNSDKEIKSFIHHVVIRTKADKKEVKDFYNRCNASVSPKAVYTDTFTTKLNQFIDKDKILIDDFSNTTWYSEVTAVQYADGTVVQILHELPKVENKK